MLFSKTLDNQPLEGRLKITLKVRSNKRGK